MTEIRLPTIVTPPGVKGALEGLGAALDREASSARSRLAALREARDALLVTAEIAAFHEAIKFADCVPRELLSRTIVARSFEMTSGDGRR